ncbi:BZ3500_MvSof-1268-A1-R1_Chr10-2g03038 [Microbotryum saponariae]|uniref:BZ3500_MvSof-1268-A1-R1_Chr10-2g03038 protein n=1 Tax=Microbotryum saponariae TaxID=289078 RepID=A0A2X0L5R4_9BASI|nr:BZ3501_MvSof-1269-A2-R1_Chr10-2g02624 [Microbotryum saponariae]SDA01974.1 BZ3500_MvSof-1268-A1-R1_Chr10-2g03038 [Microbotryum saponariae]
MATERQHYNQALANAEQQNAVLQNQVQHQNVVEEALTRISQHISTPNNPSGPKPNFKTLTPDKFNGDRRKTSNYLEQLKNVFLTSPEQFPDDQSKINYAAMCLTDEALKWFSAFRNLPESTKTSD